MGFPDRLSELMKLKKVTQQELSKKTGLSERVVRYYLSGKRSPTLESLESLADFFDVTLDYLVGRERDMPSVSGDEGI